MRLRNVPTFCSIAPAVICCRSCSAGLITSWLVPAGSTSTIGTPLASTPEPEAPLLTVARSVWIAVRAASRSPGLARVTRNVLSGRRSTD